jgi:nitrile hydratase
MAMNRALGATGEWNIDMSRFSLESLRPDVYLASSYYRKWFLGLERRLLERGLIAEDEIASGHALRAGKPLKRKFTIADIGRVLTRGSYGRPATAPARFKPGDRVRTRNINPTTHTRLPRYVRGHTGVVERVQGCHVFPDTAAIGKGEHPQWLYTVCFDARELWGDDADPTVTVSVEAFEPYLESA